MGLGNPQGEQTMSHAHVPILSNQSNVKNNKNCAYHVLEMKE